MPAFEPDLDSPSRIGDLLDRLSIGFYALKPDGTPSYANASLARIYGFPDPESFLAAGAGSLGSAAGETAWWLGARAGPDAVAAREQSRRRRDGTPLWLKETVQAVRDESGRLLQYVGLVEDVTPQRAAEEALRESERSHRRFVESLTERYFFYRHDRQGHFTYLSPSVSRVLGYGAEDYRAHYAEMFTDDPINAEAIRRTEGTLSGEWQPPYEIEVRARDGSARRLEITEYPVPGPGGEVEFIEGIARDVTDQWRAQQELRESEERYRSLALNAPEAIVVLDPVDIRFVDVNEKAVCLFGYPREVLLSMDPRKVRLSPEEQQGGRDSLEASRHVVDDAVRAGATDIEWTCRDASGRVFPVEARLVRYTHAGRVLVRGSIVDISERKKAEALREGQSRILEMIATGAPLEQALLSLTQLIESQSEGMRCSIVLLDEDGVHLRHAAAPSLPATFTEAVDGLTIGPQAGSCGTAMYWAKPVIVSDVLVDPLWRDYRELARSAGLRACWSTPILAHRGGVLGAFALYYTEARTPSPAETKLVEIATHIAGIAIERQQADQARRASEEKYRTLFEEDLSANYVAAPDGALLACNPAFARMMGYESVVTALETSFWWHHPEPEAQRSFVEAVRREGRLEACEHGLRRTDGTPLRVIENAVGRFDEHGRLVEIHGSIVDDTQRRIAEEQLRQAQRIDAVGQLAGGVAHDFNNLLSVIIGFCALLQKDIGFEHPGNARLEQIQKAADRAAGLTRQLLAFSRRQVLAPKVVDLNSIVSDVEGMLRRLIGEDIQLVTALGRRLGRVKVDPGQVEQVIVNLAVNSRDAMPRGGRLLIETANVDLDDAYVRSHPGARPGPQVLLSVKDGGHGMDAETLSHVFEPFFTTKEPGKGTGLGLATVYGIVKQSGGFIAARSEPGQGSTFEIYLPRVRDAPESRESRAAGSEQAVLGGSETVLLAEDESALRLIIRESLAGAGYRVIECTSPEAAVAAAESHSGPIHLVLTDVVMPRMSGPEVARRVLELRPEVRVIYMSGYPDEAIGRHGVLDPSTEFIQKPFTVEMILRRVREVLDRP